MSAFDEASSRAFPEVSGEADRLAADLAATSDEAGGAHESGQVRVVGVGMSAGGLEALREMVEHLPHDPRLCYVIAQHLSPSHVSLLAHLLAPCTQLRVESMAQAQAPEGGVIYVATPGHDVVMRDGLLHQVEPSQPQGPKPSINAFFASLAAEQGDRAIGVILSGTGSDGAMGMRAIRAAGGITLVQAPDDAKYDGMPKAAIHTGSVDLILPLYEMGRALARLAGGRDPALAELRGELAGDAFGRIAQAVRLSTGFRLADYKVATVRRRIARRMRLQGVATLEAYEAVLRADKGEALALVRDTFISVTSFFRDESEFAALRRTIERLVADRLAQRATSGQNRPGDVLRCWVPGCATGEEAYSIAMLFEEALADACAGQSSAEVGLDYVIFASDLDDEALAVARRGVYPRGELEGVAPGLRERYVEGDAINAVMGKRLRSRVMFARQNVLDDPPFARLDLISCRNLLIYLNLQVQEQLMRVFHFALRPGGCLFLGRAENADHSAELFRPVEARSRIFARIEGSARALPTLASASQLPELTHSGPRSEASGGDLLARIAHERLTARFVPPSVVIDGRDRVVRFQGDLAPFLSLPHGAADWDLFGMASDGLRGQLRALTFRCRRDHEPVEGCAWPVMVGGSQRLVTPMVCRLDAQFPEMLLVSFCIGEEVAPVSEAMLADDATRAGDQLIIGELENELASTRSHLNIVVEQLESSNEELQSLNEELQSANEELQSANEELQTSNEELQSTNEELLTVNEEMQVKSAELESVAVELMNMRESLTFPLLAVDRLLRVRYANRACGHITDVDRLAEGASLADMVWSIPLEGLEGDVAGVIADGAVVNRLILSADGWAYHLHAMPNRGSRGGIEGALLVFDDITKQHRAAVALADSEDRFRKAMEFAPIGMCTIGIDFGWMLINSRLCEMFELPEEQLRLRSWEELIHPDDFADQRKLFNAIRLGDTDSYSSELRLMRASGQAFWARISAALLRDLKGNPIYVITQFQDIDEEKRNRLQLAEMVEKNRLAIEAGGVGIWERDLFTEELYWDETMCAMFEEEPEASPVSVGYLLSRIHREDRVRVTEAVAHTIETGDALDVQYRVIRRDGSVRHLSSKGTLIRDASGRPERVLGACTDVTPLRELTASIEDEKRALEIAMTQVARSAEENQLLADASAHGIIAVDPQGRILMANRATQTLFGYEESELLGQPIERLVPESQRKGHAALRGDIALSDSGFYIMAQNREVQGRHHDGTLIPMDVQLRRSRSQSMPSIVATLFDLRPRLSHERELQEARVAAEAASRAKSQFLAVMSHEIRTPMNVVFGMLELIGRQGLSAGQRNYLDKALLATRSLRQIIDDVLDFSKIEADRLELEREPFSLVEMVGSIAEQLSATVTNEDVEIVLDIDAGLPEFVRGDELRLHQVLQNLTSNAVKFTPRGTVRVGMRQLRRTTRNVTLEFHVADTGIGIAPEHLDAIFAGFTQAESSTTRRFGGTGLGLAISRRLVELMGGALGVTSTVGKGSRFHFALTLPLAEGPPREATGEGQPCAPLDLLVVDDNRDLCESLAHMASDLGWHADVANTAEQGMALCLGRHEAGRPYDFVLVDWRLAGTDTALLSRSMREMKGAEKCAIVALISAHDMVHLRGDDADGQFTSVLTKPVTPRALRDLGQSLSLKRRQGATGHGEAPQAEQGGRRLQGVRILVAEDFPLNQEMNRAILEAEGAEVAIANNGREAVEMVDKGAPYDIVLMDVHMPEMDGYEATRKLRETHGAGDLPILAVTANVQKSERDRCRDAGMNDYVSKPVVFDELIGKIQSLTTRRALHESVIALKAPAGLIELEGVPLVDVEQFDTIRKLFEQRGGSTMLRTFFDGIAQLAADIDAALAAGDSASLQALAHKLTSSAGNLGAARLAALARQVDGAVFAGEGARALEMARPLPALARASIEALQERIGA
ncbi:MAG TPA: chemotaxis protein CheB [Novosphingobium sp.]|nr:chemotaxis protein CheB [Novosphingobium sp.]